MSGAEQNADDLILALDWCARQGIAGTLASLALMEGRPDMMALLCRRLIRVLQERREIESEARTKGRGRGGARVPEARTVALFLGARISQRCSDLSIAPPAELAFLIDACRGAAVPLPKGTKSPVKWNRAAQCVAAKPHATLQQIADASGVGNRMTVSQWKRLPEFQSEVAKARQAASRTKM